LTTTTANLTELITVQTGTGPHPHIAYAKSTDRIWVLNSGSQSATLLDGETGKPDGSVSFASAPVHIIIDDGSDRAYILLSDDSLAVVRLSSGEREATIALAAGSGPTALAPLPDVARMYVLSGAAATVDAVDTDTLKIVKTVAVGKQPSWGQPHKTSAGKIHVANAGSDTVSVIEQSSGEVVATVPTGARPARNAIFREANAMYTANRGDDTLTGISIATDEVVDTVRVGKQPVRLLPVQKKNGRPELWVLCLGRNATPGVVNIVNVQQKTVTELPTVDGPVNWLYEGPIGHVVAGTAKQMAIVDTRSASVVGEATLSRDPDPTSLSNMVFSRSGRLFLANADETVSVFVPAP
jgi:YVTN family beta-propeller protein